MRKASAVLLLGLKKAAGLEEVVPRNLVIILHQIRQVSSLLEFEAEYNLTTSCNLENVHQFSYVWVTPQIYEGTNFPQNKVLQSGLVWFLDKGSPIVLLSRIIALKLSTRMIVQISLTMLLLGELNFTLASYYTFLNPVLVLDVDIVI